MNRADLPITAFIDPEGTNRQAIEQLAGTALRTVLDVAATATARTPLPEAGEMPGTAIPEAPRNEQAILDELGRILRGSMTPGHPGWIGHMDPPPTTASILGDMAAAALNNNMLSVEMSPLFSRMERQLVEGIARLFGLGKQAGGLLLSGGSLANLQALTVARNVALDVAAHGVTGLSRRPVILAAEAAHTSIQKAAMLLGLGESAVRPVATNADAQMRADALEAAIDEAVSGGMHPFCVVATAGTTTTGSIDPLAAIGRICRARGLWFHVDAAYGGALVLSERQRWRLQGIELADSITFNPQKWLYVAKSCAMALFCDREVLHGAFRVAAPYMESQDALINSGEIGVQGTRHADVLKLWLSLQHLGRRGYARLIDESYRLTTYFAERLRERPAVRLAATPETNILCFRVEPDGIDGPASDDWNRQLQAQLLREARIFLSLPLYRDRRWLRAVILNPYADTAIIDRALQEIDRYLDPPSSGG